MTWCFQLKFLESPLLLKILRASQVTTWFLARSELLENEPDCTPCHSISSNQSGSHHASKTKNQSYSINCTENHVVTHFYFKTSIHTSTSICNRCWNLVSIIKLGTGTFVCTLIGKCVWAKRATASYLFKGTYLTKNAHHSRFCFT